MRTQRRPLGALAVTAAALLGAWLLIPLVDGLVRVRLLERPDHDAIVIVSGSGTACVAHWHGSACLPLWAYPVFVPSWWSAHLGLS